MMPVSHLNEQKQRIQLESNISKSVLRVMRTSVNTFDIHIQSYDDHASQRVASKAPFNGENLPKLRWGKHRECLVTQANVVRAYSGEEQVGEGNIDASTLDYEERIF